MSFLMTLKMSLLIKLLVSLLIIFLMSLLITYWCYSLALELAFLAGTVEDFIKHFIKH